MARRPAAVPRPKPGTHVKKLIEPSRRACNQLDSDADRFEVSGSRRGSRRWRRAGRRDRDYHPGPPAASLALNLPVKYRSVTAAAHLPLLSL